MSNWESRRCLARFCLLVFLSFTFFVSTTWACEKAFKKGYKNGYKNGYKKGYNDGVKNCPGPGAGTQECGDRTPTGGGSEIAVPVWIYPSSKELYRASSWVVAPNGEKHLMLVPVGAFKK